MRWVESMPRLHAVKYSHSIRISTYLKKKKKTETRQFFKNSLPTEWFRSSERTSSSFLVRAYSKYKNINIDHLFLMYASQLQKIKWQHKEDKTAWSLYLSVKQK